METSKVSRVSLATGKISTENWFVSLFYNSSLWLFPRDETGWFGPCFSAQNKLSHGSYLLEEISEEKAPLKWTKTGIELGAQIIFL